MKLIKTLLIICLFASSSFSITPQPIKNGDELVTIDFRNLEINDFIKLVSTILNKNILLQSVIPGKVEFVSTKPVYKKDLPMILQSTLAAKGFTMVDRGSFLEVVKSKDVSKYNLPVSKKSNVKYSQMITQIVPVTGANVEIVAAKVKHLSSDSAILMPVRENNTLIITDFPENIETIKKVISFVEKNAAAQVDFIKLQRAAADQIYPVLRAIVDNAFDKKIENEKVTVLANIADNSIAAVGIEKNLKKVRQIVENLDKDTESLRKVTEVIRLKNTEVKGVHAIVNQILAASRAGRAADAPILAADEISNSLVIVGTQQDYEDVSKIVKELDKEQKQVYVQARIIEISDALSNKLGFKYGLEGGEATSNGLYTFAMNMGGPTIALSSTLSSIIKPGDLKSGLAFGAAVDFLATNGAANIVSEPSILCLDNLESKIYVGKTQSIITSATNKDSTTDLSRNTYSREDIGLTLKVKPRISNDGKVTLQIETKLEDVLDGSGDGGTPTTTKREVTTRAIVKNGESVIVGGLIQEKEIENESKVPLLGDIPALGKLFSHNIDVKDKLNIVIVLTPYIVEKSEDLSGLRSSLVELDLIQNQYNKKLKEELEKKIHKSEKAQEQSPKTEIKQSKNPQEQSTQMRQNTTNRLLGL